MTHSLTLGSLLLTDSMPDADHAFVFDILADGASFGAAQSVDEVVQSLLADGDPVRTRRYGNREVTFSVEVTGPTLDSLAQGEAALRHEVGRANILTWTAPDVFAVPTVFEVLTSSMAQKFDDLDELRRRRTFTLTLTCAPWGRSAEMVTVDALASGTTTVSIDTCDSAVGWSGTRNGFPYDASAAWEAGSVGVAELETPITSPETWTLTRTGVVDFTATPYLKVEVRTIATDVGAPMNVTAYAGAVVDSDQRLPVLSIRRIAGAYFEVIYDATGHGSVAALTFQHITPPGHPWQGIFVRQVSRTDVLPGVNGRQLTRVIEPGGTERTPASIQVATPEGGGTMGLTIVHTSPLELVGYSPPLRQYRVSGNAETASAATSFSYFTEPIYPNWFRAEVPDSSLPPGGYLICAALMATTGGIETIRWQVQTEIGGSSEGAYEGTVRFNFATANVWYLVPLAVTTLPTIKTTGGSNVVVSIKRADAGTLPVNIDDAWLFRMDEDCALTITNNTQSYLWLDSPDVNSPVPQVWTGQNSDKSEARHPGSNLLSHGNHVLHPKGTALFTATRNVNNAAASATLYRRWHSNAGN